MHEFARRMRFLGAAAAGTIFLVAIAGSANYFTLMPGLRDANHTRRLRQQAVMLDDIKVEVAHAQDAISRLRNQKLNLETRINSTLQLERRAESNAAIWAQASVSDYYRSRQRQREWRDADSLQDTLNAWKLQMPADSNGSWSVLADMAEQRRPDDRDQTRYHALLAKKSLQRLQQLRNQSTELENKLFHVSKELDIEVNRSMDLNGNLHNYVLSLHNSTWSFDRNGESTCGSHRMKISSDIVTYNETTYCIDWCNEQFPLLPFLVRSYEWLFLTTPNIPSWFFKAVGWFKKIINFNTFPWYCLLMAVVATCGRGAICAFGLPTGIFVVLLCVLALAVVIITLVIPTVLKPFMFVIFLTAIPPLIGAYFAVHFFLGKPVQLCMKTISSFFVGQLPEFAGPLAGACVLLIGAILLEVKRRFFTLSEACSGRRELLAKIDELTFDGIRATDGCVIIGADFFIEAAVEDLGPGEYSLRDMQTFVKSMYNYSFLDWTLQDLGMGRDIFDLELVTRSDENKMERVKGTRKVDASVPTITTRAQESKSGSYKDVVKYMDNLMKKLAKLEVHEDFLEKRYYVESMHCTCSTRCSYYPVPSKQVWQQWAKEQFEQPQFDWSRVRLFFRPEIKPNRLQDSAQETAENKDAGRCCTAFRAVWDFLAQKGKEALLCLPVSDNYSDMAQTVSFLRKGQPLYCYYSAAGIACNVASNLSHNPPLTRGFWFAMDIIGRFFQADVMEATLQSVRSGAKSQMFLEKTAIQASTESVQNIMIVLFAILDSQQWTPEGLGLDRYLPEAIGSSRLSFRYVVDFLAVSGDVGMLSSLILSAQSIYSGLGDAPQWVFAMNEAAKEGHAVKPDFKPSYAISVLRALEITSLCGTIATAAYCTRMFLPIYTTVVVLTFVSWTPVCPGAEEFIAAQFNVWDMALNILQALFWPIYPTSLSWTWHRSISGFEAYWFYTIHSCYVLLLWACLLVAKEENLINPLPYAIPAGPSLLDCCKASIIWSGLSASVLLPITLLAVHREQHNARSKQRGYGEVTSSDESVSD
eukprot:TRINITY_DN35474_c0_g1_i1.p1 TRINITY_DN35474_c0_g1~~TRINITY_DN35474_c0_g1_i1.p1  ORF type:complete len:1040 (-),score=133.30 TRINITY_DN35474_c0_g1_i1:72-3191(-)